MVLKSKMVRIGFTIITIVIFFFLAVFYNFIKEDKIFVLENGLEIEGLYGETVHNSELAAVRLVPDVPDIIEKSQGFTIGNTKKGYYLLEDGREVKLVINSSVRPLILIEKTNNEQIYFSSKEENNADIVQSILLFFPSLGMK